MVLLIQSVGLTSLKKGYSMVSRNPTSTEACSNGLILEGRTETVAYVLVGSHGHIYKRTRIRSASNNR